MQDLFFLITLSPSINRLLFSHCSKKSESCRFNCRTIFKAKLNASELIVFKFISLYRGCVLRETVPHSFLKVHSCTLPRLHFSMIDAHETELKCSCVFLYTSMLVSFFHWNSQLGMGENILLLLRGSSTDSIRFYKTANNKCTPAEKVRAYLCLFLSIAPKGASLKSSRRKSNRLHWYEILFSCAVEIILFCYFSYIIKLNMINLKGFWDTEFYRKDVHSNYGSVTSIIYLEIGWIGLLNCLRLFHIENICTYIFRR